MKYHVTSYYLATGMEGIPDEQDYGIVEAESEDDAKMKIAIQELPEDIFYGPNGSWSTRAFLYNTLRATEEK